MGLGLAFKMAPIRLRYWFASSTTALSYFFLKLQPQSEECSREWLTINHSSWRRPFAANKKSDPQTFIWQ